VVAINRAVAVGLFAGGGSPPEPSLHVVILWRRDASHIKYEWLSSALDVSQWNDTKQALESTLQRLLHSSQALSYEAVVKVLFSTLLQKSIPLSKTLFPTSVATFRVIVLFNHDYLEN